jgi:hypothetical protein
MPDSWDPERYRERAKEWRDKAASLPEGHHQQDAGPSLTRLSQLDHGFGNFAPARFR